MQGVAKLVRGVPHIAVDQFLFCVFVAVANEIRPTVELAVVEMPLVPRNAARALAVELLVLVLDVVEYGLAQAPDILPRW